MPVSEIKPGMVGIGRTVFQGTTIEEFKVHILGVLRSNIGPQRDLILARLEGGPLAKTGVIAGMSGSPVYIDGQLVGAVSYSLGAFATEPIAGITPIARDDAGHDPAAGPAPAARRLARRSRSAPACPSSCGCSATRFAPADPFGASVSALTPIDSAPGRPTRSAPACARLRSR